MAETGVHNDFPWCPVSVLFAMPTTKSVHLAHLGRTYLTCFYLFGQSSISPRITSRAISIEASKRGLCSRALEVVPSLCFAVTTLAVGYVSFHKFTFVSSTFDLIVYSLFISSALSTCLLVLHRTPTFGHRSQHLWMKFVQCEHYFLHRLQHKMTFDHFRRRYNWTIFVMLACFSLMLVTRFTYNLRDHDCCSVKRHSAALTLIFVTMLADFQILFYIKLLGNMLENVNQHIVEIFSVIDCGQRSRRLTATLKVYKVVYYKLYDISQSINDYFGWILVSLVMQKANGTVQSFYWFIVELYEENVFAYPPILSK